MRAYSSLLLVFFTVCHLFLVSNCVRPNKTETIVVTVLKFLMLVFTLDGIYTVHCTVYTFWADFVDNIRDTAWSFSFQSSKKL
jgi:hypothetical protein